MGIILKPEDIEPFADIPREKLEAMIADVEAVAISVAPCIAKPDFKYKEQLRLFCAGLCCAGMIPGFRVRCTMSLRVLSLRLHGLILPRICCGFLRLPR